jgi:hypothetical protein
MFSIKVVAKNDYQRRPVDPGPSYDFLSSRRNLPVPSPATPSLPAVTLWLTSRESRRNLCQKGVHTKPERGGAI